LKFLKRNELVFARVKDAAQQFGRVPVEAGLGEDLEELDEEVDVGHVRLAVQVGAGVFLENGAQLFGIGAL